MDGGEAGWEEVTGVDGITRIFGYVPSSLPPSDFFLSIGEAKAESFVAINSAAWRGAALILIGLLGSICVAWAGRNLVFGTAQGLRQATAKHRRLIRAELRACVLFWPQLVRFRRLHRASVGSLHERHGIHFGNCRK